MPVNDKIRLPDYNDIQSKVAGVLGGGTSASGYGQTLRSSQADLDTKVGVNQWGNLRYDIINAYRHIYGAAPTIVTPTADNIVRYDTSFTPSADMAVDAPNTQYDTWANVLIANRFTVHFSQLATRSDGTTSSTWPGPYGTSWSTKIQCIVTATWPTAAEARYYFNSGMRINFSASKTVGTLVNTQNTSWQSLLSSAGTQQFGGNSPGTGIDPNDGTNFYRCSNVYGVWYSTFASSPYGTNNYRISARTPSVVDNSSGSANQVEFLLEFIDNYTDPVPGGGLSPTLFPPYDQVDGTFTIAVSHQYTTGILEPTGAGNFTVTEPVMTLGAIAPA